jgi:hypothetical protein
VLFDAIKEVASENPDANIWDDERVQRRLEDLGIYIITPTEGNEVAPVPDTQDTGVPDGGEIAPAAPVPPVAEALNSMRRAAGLAESILDESGETMDHILNRFKFEVKQFKTDGDLDHDLYEALFDYYMDKGEIPYGVAKGRTGDPYEWISDKFAQDIGINEGAAVDAYMAGMSPALAHFADQLDKSHEVQEGSCNATMEGEYCPEHGLMECGMYEMGTTAGGMAPVMGEGDQQAFVNKNHNDAINYNGAITGSYYESKEGDALLARMKSLALIK